MVIKRLIHKFSHTTYMPSVCNIRNKGRDHPDINRSGGNKYLCDIFPRYNLLMLQGLEIQFWYRD